MAVAFSTVTSGIAGPATSITISHGVSGTNRFMTVGVSTWDSVAAEARPNACTYASVTATQLGQNQDAGNDAVTIFGLADPTTGTNNVIVSMSGTCSEIIAGVSSYTGVNQATPTSAFVGTNASSSAPSLAISSGSDNLVIDCGYVNNVVPSAGALQTSRYNLNIVPFTFGMGSTETGTTSVTMSWGKADAAAWVLGAVTIRASSDVNIDSWFMQSNRPERLTEEVVSY